MAAPDRLVFKSAPLTGIMASEYFQLASPTHFWCRRRFDVLQKMAGGRLRTARRAVEIGCGSGVLQRQIEDAYPLAPAGFDLHEAALRQNVSRRADLYCYDIHQRAPEFGGAFDLALLFDVLEHIDDEDGFLASTKFHLTEGGCLIVNVPALPWLFSEYDRVQGHRRRYTLRTLQAVAERNGFRVRGLTYWGAPLVPVAALRKAVLTLGKTRPDAYSTGFDPGSPLRNACLYGLSRLEVAPQRLLGTSAMAVLEVNSR